MDNTILHNQIVAGSVVSVTVLWFWLTRESACNRKPMPTLTRWVMGVNSWLGWVFLFLTALLIVALAVSATAILLWIAWPFVILCLSLACLGWIFQSIISDAVADGIRKSKDY